MTVQVVRFTVKGMPVDAPIDSSAGASGVGMGRPYTVIYDGQCKVCGRVVKLLRKWDAGSNLLEIIPSQTPGLQARFPWIPTRAYLESVQLVGPGGQTWQGAAAVERLLDALPKGGLVTWVFSIPFARPLAERFYRWFARNRYRLGCGAHCTYRELSLEFGDEEAAKPAH
jgi:predicted DCC family thiol-disulfide oxidoreductase YuxK